MAATAGQVHKVIRVIASSPDSWEDAARAAVNEAAKTIVDLDGATLVKADSVVRDGGIVSYRVKLEMGFRIDRSRPGAAGEAAVQVRRYLILANQTLPSAGLHELINEKVSTGNAEFHVLVPEGPRSPVYGDPLAPSDPVLVETVAHDRLVALQEAEERLDTFRVSFMHLGPGLTGEVGLGDPLAATRRVMERAVFDEIIVSTLPSGISRWLKMDLP
ncbi:MAG: dodecin family protein, partial [Acidimicrobiales bacterium]